MHNVFINTVLKWRLSVECDTNDTHQRSTSSSTISSIGPCWVGYNAALLCSSTAAFSVETGSHWYAWNRRDSSGSWSGLDPRNYSINHPSPTAIYSSRRIRYQAFCEFCETKTMAGKASAVACNCHITYLRARAATLPSTYLLTIRPVPGAQLPFSLNPDSD